MYNLEFVNYNMWVNVRLPLIERIAITKTQFYLANIFKIQIIISKGCQIYPNYANCKKPLQLPKVTTTSKETGKLLDSKTENTQHRWFESRM